MSTSNQNTHITDCHPKRYLLLLHASTLVLIFQLNFAHPTNLCHCKSCQEQQSYISGHPTSCLIRYSRHLVHDHTSSHFRILRHAHHYLSACQCHNSSHSIMFTPHNSILQHGAYAMHSITFAPLFITYPFAHSLYSHIASCPRHKHHIASRPRPQRRLRLTQQHAHIASPLHKASRPHSITPNITTRTEGD